MPEVYGRLLIVDDEADSCDNLSDIFTDMGYQVDTAHDGASALKLVGQNIYDVALLDLRMPGMDGLELYRHIRKLSAGTVAIVVTAYASSNTAMSVLGAGAWKILPKPVDFPQLLQLVDQALRQPLILVVDDDHDLCDSLWELFHERNYRVCLAHDVPQAVHRLVDQQFDVLLVDLKLPNGDGTQILECLRQTNSQARSIMITGFRAETERRVQSALGQGASAVCYKPFDVDELLTTVGKLCGPQVSDQRDRGVNAVGR
jgi:two-component system, NtrC family, response regulator HydG